MGVQRWLEARGAVAAYDDYLERRRLRQDLMELIAEARADLEALYSSAAGDNEKRSRKSNRLNALQEAIAACLRQAGRDPGSWLNGALNNARLVSMTLYEGRLAEFRELLALCEYHIDCFYDAARELAGR